MRVIEGLASCNLSGVVLTIGNFDGVHRGHQAIISAGRSRAKQAGAELVAMTFDPHPLAILTPDHVPARLTPLEEKLRCLERAGIETTVVVEANTELLSISAEDFITDVIVARFQPVAVVEGESFGFGHKRRGSVATLREAGLEQDFEVDVIPPVRIALGGHPDTVISSSLVRQLIASGTVDQAATCLGRPYRLLGSVVRGAARGKRIGYPTANLDVGDQLVPAEGVYAGRTEQAGRLHPAALSIGRCETFGGKDVIVEAHLLDFDGDLYDRPMWVDILDWLRPQERFDTVEDLQQAMAGDSARARQVFEETTF